MYKAADKRNKVGRVFSLVLLSVCLIVGSSASFAAAVASHRAGTWEGYLSANYMNSETVDFSGGASADVNGDLGWIFGFGYNFSEKLNLDVDLGWNSMSYNANRVIQGTPNTNQQYGGWMETTSTRFNLTYNFIAKTITPFVSANVGWAWIDSNIPASPPSTGCWWDPWYGYVCSGYQSTYASSEYTYGAALGIRFDLGQNVFIRGIVNEQWVDIGNASGTPSFTAYRVDLGVLLGK